MDALYATILVLVVTNQRIVLAADSRKTYLDKKGVNRVDILDKIYKSNDWYYAVCGFNEEEGKFSLHKLIHEYLAVSGKGANSIKNVAHALATALKQYFEDLKRSSPAVFQQLLSISASGGEVFIISRVNALPTAYLIDYRVNDGSPLQVTVNTWSIDTKAIGRSDACFWRAVGNVPGSVVNQVSEKDWATQPVKQAKQLIEEGCKQYPAFVSAPVNILELTVDGVNWIEKTHTAPNCSNSHN